MRTTTRAWLVRFATFVVMVAVSIPLFPLLGLFVLGPLLQLLLPGQLSSTPFWHLLDDFVFDMPVRWLWLVFPPDGFAGSGGRAVLQAEAVVGFSSLWLLVGAAYAWLARNVRLKYLALGVYPIVYVVALLAMAVLGVFFDLWAYGGGLM